MVSFNGGRTRICLVHPITVPLAYTLYAAFSFLVPQMVFSCLEMYLHSGVSCLAFQYCDLDKTGSSRHLTTHSLVLLLRSDCFLHQSIPIERYGAPSLFATGLPGIDSTVQTAPKNNFTPSFRDDDSSHSPDPSQPCSHLHCACHLQATTVDGTPASTSLSRHSLLCAHDAQDIGADY